MDTSIASVSSVREVYLPNPELDGEEMELEVAHLINFSLNSNERKTAADRDTENKNKEVIERVYPITLRKGQGAGLSLASKPVRVRDFGSVPSIGRSLWEIFSILDGLRIHKRVNMDCKSIIRSPCSFHELWNFPESIIYGAGKSRHGPGIHNSQLWSPIP